jgi:hypothetical protein
MSTLSADTSTCPISTFSQLSSDNIIRKNVALTNINSSSTVTYTVDQIFDGGIFRTGNNSQVFDVLPSATELRSAFATRSGLGRNSLPVYIAMDFIIYNDGNASIDLQAGSNVTFNGRTIVSSKRAIKVRVVITNNFGIVLADAYTLYGHR